MIKNPIGQTSKVWQTEAMYLNLSVEGDALLEKHMKGTIKVPTKRQNDTHFLNCFTGSQPRGEVSLRFVDRRSDVFFVPTF